MSTKQAVTDFLQLGAKYELILAGLYDDLVRLKGTVDDVERRNHDSAKSVDRATSAVSEMQLALMQLKEEVTAVGRNVEQQYHDLVRLKGTVDDVERRNHDSVESVDRATSVVSEIQSAFMQVREHVTKMSRRLERQRTVNVLIGLVSITAAVVALTAAVLALIA
jgi:RecB family exonuclease